MSFQGERRTLKTVNVFAILLILISSFTASRATVIAKANPTPSSSSCDIRPVTIVEQIRDIQKTSALDQCQKDYQDNKCADYKNSLPPTERDSVLSCEPKELLPSAGAVLVGCGHGTVHFVIDTVKGLILLPQAILGGLERAGQWYRQCEADPNIRQALLAPIAMTYSKSKLDKLTDLHCVAIERLVGVEERNINSAIAEKQRLRSVFRRLHPKQPVPAHLQLTDGEKEFLAYQARNSKDVLKAAWKRLRPMLKCLKPAAQASMVCNAVAGLILPEAAESRVLASAALKGASEITEAGVKAERLLKHPLTSAQRTAVEKAHLIGKGPVGHYTAEEIRQKALVLKAAGFKPDEIRSLMTEGVVGWAAPSRGSNKYNYSPMRRAPTKPLHDYTDDIALMHLGHRQRAFDQTLHTASKVGGGGRKYYFETPEGIAQRKNWPEAEFESVADSFFDGVPPERIQFKIEPPSDRRPADKVTLYDEKNPSHLIVIDPAAGYFRIMDKGKWQKIQKLGNGNYTFEPSSNAEQTHIAIHIVFD